MTRSRAGALAVGLALAVLGAGACTGSATPEDPTGAASATRTDRPPAEVPGDDPTASGDRGRPPGGSDEPTAGASAGPGEAPTAAPPEVTSLGGATGAAPLVARSGWEVVGASGACVLSSRAATDPAAPTAGPRDTSAALLAETVAADGGDLTAPRDVLLPLLADGVTRQGVNAAAQDWTVTTPRGEVRVRGAARVVSVPTFEGDASTQSVVLALDCAGPLDEGAWQRLLADVRVGLAAPAEELGTWPS
ncbi:hypothetical protein [Cellulosimicrobium cellulans]|uniref:hypothetical protein n=1 Tax=Cellulosimicrobium cellulans TaxID=1710 RepID=UPI001BAD569C|nr:hypothetical protein [Cellulosimicrobium cellulans]QUB99757.1 hypothetical protein J5A69_19225 [Cellulosimicrobium cellulans]